MKGIGIDIEEVKRFSKKKFEKNRLFYEKIFSNDEIKYCLKMTSPYIHFAARFCAKEAAIKALEKKANLNEIEIVEKNGIPTLKLPMNQKGFLSISHTDEYAIAIVILL